MKCSSATFPPTAASCPSFVPTGVTDNLTLSQDHDGHLFSVTHSFTSTDGKAHSIDMLWDNGQRFWGSTGNAANVEYEFPGESSYSTRSVGQIVSLPSSPGTIYVRMHGAVDGDTNTGQGAIVYDRPASAADFYFITAYDNEFTMHQSGTVPAGGSTRFRFAFAQDYHAANVASLAQTASAAFLNTVTVSTSGQGKGTVTSSPAGISCGTVCSHGYAYGTSLTLEPKAARGSTFSRWTGACTGNGGCTITTNADATVDAEFALRPCIVPNVVGKTLKAAKAALKKAFCATGKVKRSASSRVKKGHVISQKPRAHKKLRQHAKVNLVVSTG